MSVIRLIEGPVGAGKSTYAAQLASQQGGVHISLDRWFATLFSPDRPETGFVPWYTERKGRCTDVIWGVTCSLMASDIDAILELGLIQRQLREAFYRRVEAKGFDLAVYILDAPFEVLRERVRQRNGLRGKTFSMVVPDHVFEIASRLWEPPDDAERRERRITVVSADPTSPE
jgi:predicted kinase